MSRQSTLGEAGLNSVPELVGEVYEAAPPSERSRLLEHLMRPLGVLSLAVVANGVFSKLRFLGTWPELRVRPEDVEAIRADDVVQLVEFVQQASWDVIEGLVTVLSDSPVTSASAAAALLVALVLQQARKRRSQTD